MAARMPRRLQAKVTGSQKIVAAIMAAAAKGTASEKVVANDDYYYGSSHCGSGSQQAPEILCHQAALTLGFIFVTTMAYYYGKCVGKALTNGVNNNEAAKEKDDDDQPWQNISPDVSDASCECRLLEGTVVFNIEEVRDVGCQAPVTYRRKLLQPRFQPTPLYEGCFPEPMRTKLD